MKHVHFLLIILLAISVNVFCADTSSLVIFKPTGFRQSNQALEGSFSRDGLLYETPCINIYEPAFQSGKMDLDWNRLLNSGISSMLFEHKNYPNDDEMSSYSLFANGNYTVMNDKTLHVLNTMVLGNQFLLKQIYQWLLPYYKNAFELLTVEEQQLIWRDLCVAELYVNHVVEKKQHAQYRKLIKSKMLKEDIKVIGFINRRVTKKQWTVSDCKFWITTIKSEAQKMLKDPSKISSHYQITESITDNLFIATNHKGDYTLINNLFQPLLQQSYKLILHKEGSLYAYRSAEQNDFRTYTVNDYISNKTFKLFPKNEWNSYVSISDSTYLFSTKEFYGIYNHKNHRYVADSSSFLYLDDYLSGYFADRIFISSIDEVHSLKLTDNTGVFYYDYNGKKICDQPVNITEHLTYDENENLVTVKSLSLEYSPDKKIIVLENTSNQFGVIDVEGKTIVPFNFNRIDLSDYPKSILAINNLGEEKIFKIE